MSSRISWIYRIYRSILLPCTFVHSCCCRFGVRKGRSGRSGTGFVVVRKRGFWCGLARGEQKMGDKTNPIQRARGPNALTAVAMSRPVPAGLAAGLRVGCWLMDRCLGAAEQHPQPPSAGLLRLAPLIGQVCCCGPAGEVFSLVDPSCSFSLLPLGLSCISGPRTGTNRPIADGALSCFTCASVIPDRNRNWK